MIPAPEPGPISQIGQWLDIVGNGVSAGEFVLGLVGAAAAEFAVGLLGVVLAIVGVPIAMYSMWDDTDKLAAANGLLRGFSEALESMWRPYAGRELADLERWPAIAYSTRQIQGDGTVAGTAAMHGYRAGVHKANDYMRKLEREHRHKGQLWLWSASQRYGSARDLRVEVLRRQGYPRARDGYRMDFN